MPPRICTEQVCKEEYHSLNESNMNRAVDISSGSCQSIPIFATYSCLPCQLRISIILKEYSGQGKVTSGHAVGGR